VRTSGTVQAVVDSAGVVDNGVLPCTGPSPGLGTSQQELLSLFVLSLSVLMGLTACRGVLDNTLQLGIEQRASLSEYPSGPCLDLSCGCHDGEAVPLPAEKFDHGHQSSSVDQVCGAGSSSWFDVQAGSEEVMEVKSLYSKL